MKILTKILLLLLFFITDVFAQKYEIDEGFYVGKDPVKFDDSKLDIDASVDVKAKPVDGKYYGYKFSGGGFFLAPEANRKLKDINLKSFNHGEGNAQDSIEYNVKAHVGYDFNSGVSGFVTYDIGDFSYNATQKAAALNKNNSAIGFGSQLKLSNNFSLKVTYTQQQNYDNNIDGGKIKSDVIRFGSSYSF
jgi:hypothetical protein